MKRPLWIGFWALVVAAVGVSGYIVMTPKIGHATVAEIEAVLPASLKEVDSPDPEGEARYEKLLKLLQRLESRDLSKVKGAGSASPDAASQARIVAQNREVLKRVEPVLAGTLKVPNGRNSFSFGSVAKFKELSKVLRMATDLAAARKDATTTAHYAELNMRLAQRMIAAEGELVDLLGAIAMEAIAQRAIYDAEMSGGFNAQRRERMLTLLPPLAGPMPEMAHAVRQDFRIEFLPILLNPIERNASNGIDRSVVGTYDPVETARMVGKIYDEVIADSQRPFGKQTRRAEQLADKAGEGLPELGSGPSGIKGYWHRFRMNSGRNTIGRQLAAIGAPSMNVPGFRRAANRNLVRAVLLLRMGHPAAVLDPYGGGNLKFDLKRRLVWSNGENGRDDGGQIMTNASLKAPDFGYRY